MGRKKCIKTKHLLTLLLIFGIFVLYCSFNRYREGFLGIGGDDDKDEKKSFECDDDEAECNEKDKLWECDKKKRKCTNKEEEEEKERIKTEWSDDATEYQKEIKELWKGVKIGKSKIKGIEEISRLSAVDKIIKEGLKIEQSVESPGWKRLKVLFKSNLEKYIEDYEDDD